MKLLLAAVSALTVAACASAAPGAPATAAPTQAQAPAAPVGLAVYEGTYALQAPNRVIDLRVWVDAQGKLNGELVGLGQQTTFRPGAEHTFMHATRDDVWFLFTVENGRATSATMHQGTRAISGPRKP
ncbi:MAG TPA: hypothetical protein VM890_00455 [Longimicrobium sp.]|jgi:hypothetical protein|nr:hypothetical protein [Longimicrobium sp.]